MSEARHFADLRLGETHSFEHTFTSADQEAFGGLTGDTSSLSSRQAFESGDREIVHGLLVASFFSALIDMHCLGPECLYLSQQIFFRMPVFFGDLVTIRGTILDMSEATRVVTIKTEIVRGGEIVVQGEARLKMVA